MGLLKKDGKTICLKPVCFRTNGDGVGPTFGYTIFRLFIALRLLPGAAIFVTY